MNTIWDSFIYGSLSGGVEVLINHPLWTLKVRSQNNLEFPWRTPQVLYRGLLPNTISMIPITGIQVGLTRYFEHQYLCHGYPLTHTDRLLFSGIAGVVSAGICGPVEFIMSQQSIASQPNGFFSTARQLVKEGGMKRLHTGLTATALREALFTSFYLGVTPLMKSRISAYCPDETTSSTLAGLGAGVGASLSTQAIDTVKTIQQSATTPTTMWQTSKQLYAEAGLHGFFKGGMWRGVRIVSAVTLLWMMNEEETTTCGAEP